MLSLLLLLNPAAEAPARPNIVVILADDVVTAISAVTAARRSPRRTSTGSPHAAVASPTHIHPSVCTADAVRARF